MDIDDTAPTSLAWLLGQHLKRFFYTDHYYHAGVTFRGDPPRVGAMTLPPRYARLVDDVLSVVLENVETHGATEVSVSFDLPADRTSFVIGVTDNGPGFDPAVFDNVATQLHIQREAVRGVGGDLMLLPADTGATVQLVVPLKQNR